MTPTPLPELPSSHLCQVLSRSKARLQRRVRLSEGVELAVWANVDDEVRYCQPGHHTLSVYLAGGEGSQLKARPEAMGAPGRICIFTPEDESHWLVRSPVQFLHLYVSDLAWAGRVVRMLDAEPRSRTLRAQIYGDDQAFHAGARALMQLDWQDPQQQLAADAIGQQLVDRLVLMHGLETSEQPSAVLDECQRVLGPGGKALFIVPNRSGLWARGDGTPFGFGRPYSLRQLEAQIKRHGFTPERHVAALYAPPSSQRFWLRTAQLWEQTGRRFAPWIAGGVLMVEASKQVYAPTRGGLGAVVRRPLRVLEGVGQGVPEPALGRSGPAIRAGQGEAVPGAGFSGTGVAVTVV